MNLASNLGFITGCIILMLLFLGIIGPKRLQNTMRKINNWFFNDAAMFIPIDPYKPLSLGLKKGRQDLLPNAQRTRQALLSVLLVIALVAIGIYISLLVLF